MKRICHPLLLAAIALAMASAAWASPSCCPAGEKSTCIAGKAKRPTCGRPSPKVMVKEKEGWRLVVHILQPGTRSQGYHGLLYKDGQRVDGKKGERRKTPLGTFTWQGSMNERAHMWDSTGWVCEDQNPFREESMPRPKPQTSLEELDKQIDEEMGKASE